MNTINNDAMMDDMSDFFVRQLEYQAHAQRRASWDEVRPDSKQPKPRTSATAPSPVIPTRPTPTPASASWSL